jgi:hypothetical protein
MWSDSKNLPVSEFLPKGDATISAAPALLAAWDGRLRSLWLPPETGLNAAEDLFAPDEVSTESLPDATHFLAMRLWNVLFRHYPKMPEKPETRYQAVLNTLSLLLRAIQQSPTTPFVEDLLTVGLRPVCKLRAGALTPLVCSLLYDFQRGIWVPHLTKPQRWKIQIALAQTVAALPPDQMQDFWTYLQSKDPLTRQAMLLGLEFLRSAHALPHLLNGLQISQDHAVRAAIVNCLEQIADPHALPTLAQLRRETAHSDWTLSRQIARAMRVIEHQNRGQQHRTLLRPTERPDKEENALLRPVRPSSAEQESAWLVRPVETETGSDNNESVAL